MEVRFEAADGGLRGIEEIRFPPQQEYDFGPFWFPRPRKALSKKRGQLLSPLFSQFLRFLAFDYIDDFMCPWTKDDVSPAHQDEIIAAPFRVNFNNPCRKRIVANGARDDRSHGDVEVHVRNFFDLLRPDGGRNLALFFRRWCRAF